MSHFDTEDTAARVAEMSRRAYSSPLLALLRLMCIALWTAAMYCRYMARRLFIRERITRRQVAVTHSQRWFRGLLSILGIRARTSGQVPRPPVLLTPNHLGYLDIIALGALCDTLFVSKAEVESWPIIGHLFRQSEGIAVARGRTRGVHEANRAVAECLEQGLSITVFLEGTSSGGGSVKPFHSSLIQPAIDATAPVVPAAIIWCAADTAVDIAGDVAYWGGHTLVPHVWRVLGLRGLSVTVIFGEAIALAGQERKALAQAANEAVAELLNDQLGET